MGRRIGYVALVALVCLAGCGGGASQGASPQGTDPYRPVFAGSNVVKSAIATESPCTATDVAAMPPRDLVFRWLGVTASIPVAGWLKQCANAPAAGQRFYGFQLDVSDSDSALPLDVTFLVDEQRFPVNAEVFAPNRGPFAASVPARAKSFKLEFAVAGTRGVFDLNSGKSGADAPRVLYRNPNGRTMKAAGGALVVSSQLAYSGTCADHGTMNPERESVRIEDVVLDAFAPSSEAKTTWRAAAADQAFLRFSVSSSLDGEPAPNWITVRLPDGAVAPMTFTKLTRGSIVSGEYAAQVPWDLARASIVLTVPAGEHPSGGCQIFDGGVGTVAVSF